MAEILNPKTNRFVKVGSQNYKRLVREGTIKAFEPVETSIKPTPTPHPTPNLTPEPEELAEEPFSESILQSKLAEISTTMIQKNIKKIVRCQKLSDHEMDLLIKKMLFKKLCVEELPKPTKDKKLKKKSKFRLVEPSSESESD